MPIIKSAIKKLRQDRKREKRRKKQLEILKDIIKKVRNSKKKEDFIKAISLIDKSAKNHLIHKNKAAHLKSSLSKLVRLK